MALFPSRQTHRPGPGAQWCAAPCPQPRPCSPAGRLTVRALARSGVQRRVPVAVLVGRVRPQPEQQAQRRGVVAGTGPVQGWGLPGVDIEAWVSLEEGLGPDQPPRGQVTTEATLSALAAGPGGHGRLGLRTEDERQWSGSRRL